MEVVGSAALSGFFQVLFQQLASIHVVDFIRRCDMKKEVNLLQMALRKVDLFLIDAENKQYKDELVKKWLDDLRNASYDAEDVIDEIATEAKTSSDQGSFLRQAFNAPVEIVHNVSMQLKIKAIIDRFNKLKDEGSDLGLKEIKAITSFFRETSSVVDETQVYGRDDDKEKILVQLLKEDNQLCRIIPIVGMGGVGKTTLAQLVYNDNRVENHFDLKAWVCVSDDFDIKRITKAILGSVTSDPCRDDLNSLQVGVKKALTGKKFLIILDDVWNKNYENWEKLRAPFRVGVAGSAIIVTTRDNEIASKMGTVDHHSLQQLSEVDCWRVFSQHAFGIESVDANSDLVAIGKEIVRRCKGLPLAAKSLGGHLRTKEEYEWENVLNSKIWDLPEEENSILPVLKLSYHYLPSHLKRCFSYCSIFPKDYQIDREKLVSLWMAEGFLHPPKGNMNMEDFGHKCFSDLLSRSFFQPSSIMKSLFVMHDLMNDLAEWAAGKTCFRMEDSFSDRSTQYKISNNARYSSYSSGELDGVKKFKVFDQAGRLRTFLPLVIQSAYGCRYLTNVVTFDLLPKLTFLRVLSLRGYRITKLPELNGLKHLRYFDLSLTKIRCLPESFTTLYNLQTLLLESCLNLKKLPQELKNLTDLRHLDISNVTSIVMPTEVGRLTNLRKLSDFIVGKEENGPGLGQLKNLKHLQGTLRISSLQHAIDAREVIDANLSGKKGLNVLKMEWCSKSNDTQDQRVQTEVLAMLSPPKDLKELTIKGYGGISFPRWIGPSHFSNMVLLELNSCERCSVMPPLGKLPFLKDLRIRELHAVVTVGPQFYGNDCSNSFPSLENLCFEDMNEWRDWLARDVDNNNDLFPRLRKLSITRCPKLLGKLPDHLPSLENLTVDFCKELTVMLSSLPRLCKLSIERCKEVVQCNNSDLSSLKFTTLEHINRGTFATNGFIKGLTGVEELTIDECDELVCLWQKEVSLHKLTSLRKLTIERCCNIKSLYEGCLSHMLSKLSISSEASSSGPCCSNSSLEYLEINGCDSLMFIGEDWLFPTVKEVVIENCDALQYLLHKGEASSSASSSSSSSMMMMMEDINITNTSLLEVLSISGCPSLTSLFSPSSSIGALPATLKTLSINNCGKLASMGTRLNNNTCLVSVKIDDCESFKTLPSGLHYLHHLVIIYCKNFVSFPEEGLPATLKSLTITGCPKLELIGEIFHSETSLEIFITHCKRLKYLPGNLTRLSLLQISNCPRLVRFPDRGLPAKNLKELRLRNCGKLKGLSNYLDGLTSLQKLSIRGCPSSTTISFPEEGFRTYNLSELEIGDLKLCKPLVEWGLSTLTSLKLFCIRGVFAEMVSFPSEEKEIRMVLPSSLLDLSIRDLPNLVSLSSKGFQNLTSLQKLSISHCPKFQSFPDKGLFPSNLRLEIYNCPLMEQRLCEVDRGQDWAKISHIPCYEYTGIHIRAEDFIEKFNDEFFAMYVKQLESEEMEESSSDEEEGKQFRTQQSSVD